MLIVIWYFGIMLSAYQRLDSIVDLFLLFFGTTLALVRLLLLFKRDCERKSSLEKICKE